MVEGAHIYYPAQDSKSYPHSNQQFCSNFWKFISSHLAQGDELASELRELRFYKVKGGYSDTSWYPRSYLSVVVPGA